MDNNIDLPAKMNKKLGTITHPCFQFTWIYHPKWWNGDFTGELGGIGISFGYNYNMIYIKGMEHGSSWPQNWWFGKHWDIICDKNQQYPIGRVWKWGLNSSVLMPSELWGCLFPGPCNWCFLVKFAVQHPPYTNPHSVLLQDPHLLRAPHLTIPSGYLM